MDDLETISEAAHCFNCSLDLTGGYVDFYALPVSGKTITAYEGLQAVFKGYEAYSSIIRDQTKFCTPCGKIFGKLLKFYTQFLELSIFHSFNGFPHQFLNESRWIQYYPEEDGETRPKHEDLKNEVKSFCDSEKGISVNTTVLPDTYSLLGLESDHDNFLDSNTSPYDQKELDSGFSNEVCNDQTNSEERPFQIETETSSTKKVLGPFRCKICGDCFTLNWRLTMHKESEHEDVRKFRCTICDFAYKNLRDLKRHEYSKHQIRRKKIRTEWVTWTDENKALLVYDQYKCDNEGCGTVSLSSFKEWVLHQQNVHEIDTGYKDVEKQETLEPKHELIRPCPTCGKKIKCKKDVVRHMKMVHLNMRPYECSESDCRSNFVTQKELDVHKRIVHKEPKYLCNICGATHKTSASMMRHQRTHYGEEDELKFECDVCKKKFRRKSNLKDHTTLAHSEVEPSYQCEQCGSKFKVMHHLNSHMKRTHPTESMLLHSCEFCRHRFSLKGKLKEHLMSRHKLSNEAANTSAKLYTRNLIRILPNGDQVYKELKSKTCEFCDRTYSRLEYLNMHLIQVHGKTEEEAKTITKLGITKPIRADMTASTRKRKASATGMTASKRKQNVSAEAKTTAPSFRCEICGECFTLKRSLTMHKETEHEEIRKFRCTLCEFAYKNLNDLKKHKYSKHKIITGKIRTEWMTSTDDDKALLVYDQYKCDSEGCETVSLSSFKEWVLHQQNVHGIDTGYKDVEKQETLEPKHELIRPCPTCGKKIKYKSEVIRHVKLVHLNLRSYECNVCMKNFVAKYELDRHKRTVHEEPKYLCNLCGSAHKTKGNMMLHQRIHYEEVDGLKFECDVCEKKFLRKSNLKAHAAIAHSDVEPYQCEECGKKFKVISFLNYHKKRKHPTESMLLHSCEFCETRFSLKVKLKAHLMSRHKLTKEAANTSAKTIRRKLIRI